MSPSPCKNLISGSIALMLALATAVPAAHGQTKTPAPECPSVADQEKTAKSGRSGTAGRDAPETMAAEKSGILPSASGHVESAAPTVQQDGKALPSALNCAQGPSHPNKPG